MPTNDPRIRALLTQAERTAANGKLAASEQLFRDILADAPETVEAWLGLAGVLGDPAERRGAYEQVLALEPGNAAAQEGIDRLDGKLPPEPAVVVEEVPMTEIVAAIQEAEETRQITEAHDAEAYTATCYRHPDRETSLRCYSCGKPICIDCARKTPVGYICPDCQRTAEDAFFNSKPLDYLVAAVVSFPISLLAGYLIVNFVRGFFFFFLIFFISGAVGSFIGRVTKRAIGGRRGRYLPGLVVAMMVIGVLLPSTGVLLALLGGNPGALLALVGPAIYLFVAGSAAYWQMR